MLNEGWIPLIWFLGKVFAFIFVFIWLRGTLPRLRYDQFMQFGWKVLVPAGLLWIVVVSALRTLSREYDWSFVQSVVFVGIPLGIVLIVLLLLPERETTDDGVLPEGLVPEQPTTTLPDPADGPGGADQCGEDRGRRAGADRPSQGQRRLARQGRERPQCLASCPSRCRASG
ncbi:MAG: NADH-quinone oxidoreductase subunit H [Geodermatophilaceae bacterium]